MRKRLMNNWGLKILAFFVAFMMWLLVVNIDDPVTHKTFTDIPVSVINEEVLANAQQPQTYQIVDNTQEVDVTVTAKRKTLNKIKNEDIVAVADMKELTLNTQIPIDISINGYEGRYDSAQAMPRNLQIKLEDEETKRFPIVPTTTGTVRDGYVLGEIEAMPEKVSIRGPKSLIDEISRVEASVSVSGLSKDSVLESELVLYDSNNNIIDQNLLSNNLGTEGVAVRVQLMRTKTVALEFDTSMIWPAKGYGFTGITFEPQSIQIAGEYSNISTLKTIYIPAEALEVSGITEKTEKVINVSEYLPDGVTLADENAGLVVVTISIAKDGTKSYDVTVGSIIVNNLSEDLTMSYATADMLELQVRGPKETLEDLRLDQAISIDLEKYQNEGTYNVPVNVKLPENCTLEKEVSVKIVLSKRE
ncbi:MAG: YbbR-like domain-containing protein [Lachnospiraceae bacterium]